MRSRSCPSSTRSPAPRRRVGAPRSGTSSCRQTGRGPIDYRLFIEVNVEGDYNDGFNERSYPTPKTPETAWDNWAKEFGYPYRGQPSVVYAIDFTLDGASTGSTLAPLGYGSVHGDSGVLSPMGPSISDDAKTRQGSGADRLLLQGSERANLRVLMSDSAYCMGNGPPGAVQELKVAPYPDERHAHTWARLSFRTPESPRPVGSYVVEIRAEGKDWEQAYTPDSEEELLPVALDVCADPQNPGQDRCIGLPAGSELTVTLSGLMQQTRYEVRVSARDRECGNARRGQQRQAYHARARHSPPSRPASWPPPPTARRWLARCRCCARYATATWRPPPCGRAFIDFYYTVGPTLAEPVREHPWLASAVRFVLTPVVRLAAWWVSE